ncbi:MAG: DUF2065 family protein, partial [Nanoarchaeota archaeon]|nr:DUF2065 family protein [Nanoarchaeota archaeon]
CIILLALGILALIEGIIICFFPKFTKRILKEMVKNKKIIKAVGLTEIILAIIIITLAIFTNISN